MIVIAVLIGLYGFEERKEKKSREEVAVEAASEPVDAALEAAPAADPKAGRLEDSALSAESAPAPVVARTVAPPTEKNDRKKEEPFALPFVLEDGMAVVHGDIVIGQPIDENAPAEGGWAVVPKVNLWKSRRIPVHIQPSLPDPDRVRQALAMFAVTAIEFVPYDNHEDVLVFEEGTGHCKSYVGRIGGKQPIWLTPGCGPREIAHEIMHALGFIHEQNRADRDLYIQVLRENVEDQHAINFEMFPSDFMVVSGLAGFDFESLMMYPPTMFARGGLSTMVSRIDGKRIQPSEGLSPGDIERIDRAYGNR